MERKTRAGAIGAGAAVVLALGTGAVFSQRASATGPSYYQAIGQTTLTSDDNAATYAYCASGDYATGGGYEIDGGSTSDVVRIGADEPDGNAETPPTGWYVQADNQSSDTLTITAWADCVSTGG